MDHAKKFKDIYKEIKAVVKVDRPAFKRALQVAVLSEKPATPMLVFATHRGNGQFCPLPDKDDARCHGTAAADYIARTLEADMMWNACASKVDLAAAGAPNPDAVLVYFDGRSVRRVTCAEGDQLLQAHLDMVLGEVRPVYLSESDLSSLALLRRDALIYGFRPLNVDRLVAQDPNCNRPLLERMARGGAVEFNGTGEERTMSITRAGHAALRREVVMRNAVLDTPPAVADELRRLCLPLVSGGHQEDVAQDRQRILGEVKMTPFLCLADGNGTLLQPLWPADHYRFEGEQLPPETLFAWKRDEVAAVAAAVPDRIGSALDNARAFHFDGKKIRLVAFDEARRIALDYEEATLREMKIAPRSNAPSHLSTQNLAVPPVRPYPGPVTRESPDLVAAVAARIESLRGEMERAPDWKRGTEWYTDRAHQLAADERQLAELASEHPLLLANRFPVQGQAQPTFIHTSLAELEVVYPDLYKQIDFVRETLEDDLLLRIDPDGIVRWYTYGDAPETAQEWQELEQPVRAADLPEIHEPDVKSVDGYWEGGPSGGAENSLDGQKL